jgi:5'-methylthioadenosine phosphorylase
MKLGIIGGTGLYQMEALQRLEERTLSTPFGEPSDRFIIGRIGERDVVFLSRHGQGHRLLPSEINYRANIWGMKSLGVTHLVAVSAVGSLQEKIAPGHFVIPDQYIDRTQCRPSTFFGDGIAAHLQFGRPVCPELSKALVTAGQAIGVTIHEGGTYICMEGPMFSTRAESEMYRRQGAAVIGMTNLQEAKLAREAEICFATIALSSDYDCWHETEAEVSVAIVLEVMRQNVENAQKMLMHLSANFQPAHPPCPDQSALSGAILTTPASIPAKTRERLGLLVDKYLR